MNSTPPSDDEVEARYKKLGMEAEEGGYHLNPDREFTTNLVRGLLVNENRIRVSTPEARSLSAKILDALAADARAT